MKMYEISVHNCCFAPHVLVNRNESIERGEPNPADIALLKVQASEVMEFCAREALQILGGLGFMRFMDLLRM